MPVTLILGGARSGKSRRAEELALSLTAQPLYVATAPYLSDDAEWRARIAHHRRRRGSRWRLIEEELALVDVLRACDGRDQVVVVDCLTLWLSNLMLAGKDCEREVARLCELLATLAAHVILVSNEVGMGLVPESAEGRVFRDAQGRLNQAVAAVAERVEFVAAGLPITLKGGKE